MSCHSLHINSDVTICPATQGYSWLTAGQVDGTAAMILHCGSLFGTYFGGSNTSRSHRGQSHRQHTGSNDQLAGDQMPYMVRQHASGPARMVSAIAGIANEQPWGLENQSMGPGSLNSKQQAQQKLAKKLSLTRPPPIDVDAASSSSSGSARSASAKARRLSGSLPSSPVKRQASLSDRSRQGMPWLQGKQAGPVEKALQKNKIRSL